MGRADFFRPGSYNKICDRTGFKIKAEYSNKEWTGSTVRMRSWEPRHPQDFIRAVIDNQAVNDPNPESPDTFEAVSSDSTVTIWDDGSTVWDNGDTIWVG